MNDVRLPEIPVAGYQLMWWSFDGEQWQVIAAHDDDDATYQGLGSDPDAAIQSLREAIESEARPDSDDLPRHPTVRLDHHDEPVDIDEQLAPLIEQLWAIGIETVSSCQGGPGRSVVEFETTDDAEWFIQIAAGAEDPDVESVWNRITRSDEPEDNPDWDRWRRERLWRFYGVPRLWADRIGFGIVADFPPADIPLLVERFNRERRS